MTENHLAEARSRRENELSLLTQVAGYCWKVPGIETVPAGYTYNTYNVSYDFLHNPGRGFTEEYPMSSQNFEILSKFKLDALRLATGATLVLRHYVLDIFNTNILSEEFITRLRRDLDTVKEAGFMVIIRFSYTKILSQGGPYGDATKRWIKIHIGQLKEVFYEYQGIIITVQAGFIGTWGEWYYTDHFGLANNTMKNWNDRREVLYEILGALPEPIQVQLRTPHFKRTLFGETPTNYDDMYSRRAKSRIGFHNDCFLSGENDKGTYSDYPTEYEYLREDDRFVIVGGETCSLASDDRHLCPNATKELEELSFTFLAQSYNKEVLNLWRNGINGSCYNEIGLRLGYRLALKQSILPLTVGRGGIMSFHIVLVNLGYAAPLRPMNVYLALFSEVNGVYNVPIETNTRTWLPGMDIVLSGAVKVPHAIPPSDFSITLVIGDRYMHDQSDYYILLANENVPWPDMGINDLRHIVQIVDGVEDDDYYTGSTCQKFSSWNPPMFASHPRVLGSSTCLKTKLQNNDFEDGATVWQPYQSGYLYRQNRSLARQGKGFIEVSNGAAYQRLTFPKDSTESIISLIARAWSKHSGDVTIGSNRYSVYCDVWAIDGTPFYGLYEPFQGGINGTEWHSATLTVNINQGIADAYCYLRYDGVGAGFAYFDLFDTWILTGTAQKTDCNLQD